MVNVVINLANKHIISLYPEKVNVLYLFTYADFKHFIDGFTGVLPKFCFAAGLKAIIITMLKFTQIMELLSLRQKLTVGKPLEENGITAGANIYKVVTNVYKAVTNIDFCFCSGIIKSRT